MNIQTKAADFQIDAKRINGLLDLGFSKSEIYQIVAPQRTLARRKDKLSLEESDKVERLERIIEHATRVFGARDLAQEWLRDKNRALHGNKPIDLLMSETGADTVKQQLYAIQYGMYA